MHPMTVGHLQSAFSGESQAHMRYLIYSDKAGKDGFANVSRLFTAIAFAEQVHASNHFRQLKDESGAVVDSAHAGFGLGATTANLDIAIGGETFEIEEMYPVYKAAAELQQEAGALRAFDWAWQAEQTHAAFFKEAKAAIEGGQDMQVGPIYVCDNCGHTLTGEPPERCPICKVPRERYREFK
jgi:rubrerythrin